MACLETVYAIHSFEAENQDEIGFLAGEPIVVLEKDEGYNDGWWQGRNARGEIGLFPMNYTSGSSTSGALDKKINSLEDAIAKMQVSPSHSGHSSSSSQLPTPSTSTHRSSLSPRDRYSVLSSLISGSIVVGGGAGFPTYSDTATDASPPPSPPIIQSPAITRNVQIKLQAALNHRYLIGTEPEDWDVDQVAAWMYAMGFSSVAENFKAQEITGDILLELTLHSLKEVDVDTFGKRFKIYTAIMALREFFNLEETGYYNSWCHESDYSTSSIDEGASDFESVITMATSPVDSVASSSSSSSEERSFSYHGKNNTTAVRKMSVGRKNVNADIYKSIRSQGPAQSASFSPTSKPQTILMVADQSSSMQDSRLDHPHYRHTATADATPEMEGWLSKRGDKYKTWNKRWFVLKGANLFYFKSPRDVRMKGIINLRGYRIICDECIYAGKWCFKAQHERERTFYFYTDAEATMKAWIKSLMKATISRDFGAPVMSSSTIPTVSLDIARRMKPRPPSMILYKKEHRKASHSKLPTVESIRNLNEIISEEGDLESEADDDDLCAMLTAEESYLTDDDEDGSAQEDEDGYNDHSTLPRTIESQEELQDSGFDGTENGQVAVDRVVAPNEDVAAAAAERTTSTKHSPQENGHDEDEQQQQRPHADSAVTGNSFVSASGEWTAFDYLDWIQDTISSSRRSCPISSLDELRSGEILIVLLESLSGKTVRRPAKSTHGSTSMEMLDNIVSAFKFMSREGINVHGQFTIKDVFGANEPKIMEMLDAIRVWADKFR